MSQCVDCRFGRNLTLKCPWFAAHLGPDTSFFGLVVTTMSAETLQSKAWSCATLEAGAKSALGTAGVDLQSMDAEQLERTLKDQLLLYLLWWG